MTFWRRPSGRPSAPATPPHGFKLDPWLTILHSSLGQFCHQNADNSTLQLIHHHVSVYISVVHSPSQCLIGFLAPTLLSNVLGKKIGNRFVTSLVLLRIRFVLQVRTAAHPAMKHGRPIRLDVANLGRLRHNLFDLRDDVGRLTRGCETDVRDRQRFGIGSVQTAICVRSVGSPNLLVNG